MQMLNPDSADKLNALLRGEIAATETYNMALEKIQDANLRQELESVLSSHRTRVKKLADKVRELGIEPSKEAGAWGAFAKTIQGGALVLGDKAAIFALEEGEDKGLKDYHNSLNDNDPIVNEIAADMLRHQESTHTKLHLLKERFH